MRIHGRADSVKFVGDECGWELHVETDEGDTIIVNVHSLAWDLAEHTDKTLGAWRREGEYARATMPPRIEEEDLDGYPLGHYKRAALEEVMRNQR
jgi:hypothetical protein